MAAGDVYVHMEKLTGTDYDELGVELETLQSGLKIASIPEETYQIDIWNKNHPDQCIRCGDVIMRVNGIGPRDTNRMRSLIQHGDSLSLIVRRFDCIYFYKLNGVSPHYRDYHKRVPDLSADIRIVFPNEEYIGHYVAHGQSKTVFVLEKAGHRPGSFHGCVLKITRANDDSKVDIEPEILKSFLPQEYQVVPRLYWEGHGTDNCVNYQCWITERCIPLDRIAALSTCDKDACVLAACRCLSRAARSRIQLSDCHYYNLGVRIKADASAHEVVVIDWGSRQPEESDIKNYTLTAKDPKQGF